MSNAVQLTEDQKQLIEKIGVMHEHSGMQPAASRISALLLISPDTELSFDQIRETLGLSKSATSNAINMMLTVSKIDYITKPGDRKRYFKSKVASWQEDIKRDFSKFTEMADRLEEVLKQRPGNTTEFNGKLEDVIDFLRFMNTELPNLYKKWQDSK